MPITSDYIKNFDVEKETESFKVEALKCLDAVANHVSDITDLLKGEVDIDVVQKVVAETFCMQAHINALGQFSANFGGTLALCIDYSEVLAHTLKLGEQYGVILNEEGNKFMEEYAKNHEDFIVSAPGVSNYSQAVDSAMPGQYL